MSTKALLMKIKDIRPGKILRLPSHHGYSVWEITGVFLGGESQESVVEVDRLDLRHPTEEGRVLVPVSMIEAIMTIQEEEEG